MSFAKKFLKNWLTLRIFRNVLKISLININCRCQQIWKDLSSLLSSCGDSTLPSYRVTLSTRQIAFLSRTCKKLDSWGPINLSFIFSRNHAGLRWISNSHFAGCVTLHPRPSHLSLKNIIVPHSQTCICNSFKCTFYLKIERSFCVTF